MNAPRSSFGNLGGRDVGLTTLRVGELEVRVLDYGATVQALVVPDRTGHRDDVVLGFERLQDYVDNTVFLGGTVGRVANRIARGRFELDGRAYELGCNNGPDHLHGGFHGWDKVLWKYEGSTESAERASVLLSYDSPAGEGGYPGRVRAEAEFSLDRTGTLGISMRGLAEERTLFNLAHHGYFNLGGTACASVLDHELELASDEMTPGAPVVPDGRVTSVANTAFDFRSPKALGRDLPLREGAPRGYDDNLLIRGNPSELRRVARLVHRESGRVMEVSANQPAVQLYTGNYLDGRYAGKGRTFGQYSAICLETQAIPNAINVPAWRNQVILEPGRAYRHEMTLRFTAE